MMRLRERSGRVGKTGLRDPLDPLEVNNMNRKQAGVQNIRQERTEAHGLHFTRNLCFPMQR